MSRPAVHRRVVAINTPASAADFCRVRGLRLGFVAMIAMFAAIPAISQAPGFTELTTIRQIRHLKASTPDIGVHVRGVVTYYDTVAPNLFVQDPTGGIWVDLRKSTAKPPLPGQMLDLQGIVGFGFSPYIANPRWTVVGKSAPPKPHPVTYDDAATGSFDGQWVQMDGVVRSFVQQAEGAYW